MRFVVRIVTAATSSGLVLLGACADQPTGTPTAAPSAPAVTAAPPPAPRGLVTFDDKLAAIARADSTFGGLYIDQGKLAVVSTDLSRGASAMRRAIATAFPSGRLSTLPIVLRHGRYSFATLHQWASLIPPLFVTVDELVGYSIDERGNRLSINIEAEAGRTRVESELVRLGIPPNAFQISIMERPVAASHTLQDRVRNVYGGLKISGDNYDCTLGFNVRYDGMQMFATNGHCTNFWDNLPDATRFWQNTRFTSGDLLGSEYLEAPDVTSLQDPRCPYNITGRCRYSDIALVRYTTSLAQPQGYIYRPTSRTQYGPNLTIDHSNALLTVTYEELFPFLNDRVDKIGAATGWTYADVTDTCWSGDVLHAGFAKHFICVHRATGGVGAGDSGAAVFYYTPGSGNVSLAGQMIGRQGTTTWIFASLNNIQAQIGNIVTSASGIY